MAHKVLLEKSVHMGRKGSAVKKVSTASMASRVLQARWGQPVLKGKKVTVATQARRDRQARKDFKALAESLGLTVVPVRKGCKAIAVKREMQGRKGLLEVWGVTAEMALQALLGHLGRKGSTAATDSRAGTVKTG